MNLLNLFLYCVGAIVVFGALAWLIDQWVPDPFKKFAWSALVVLAVVIFLLFLFGGYNLGPGLQLHR